MALPPRELGQRITAARKKHGWKSEELAFFSGVTLSYLTRLERGGVQDPGYHVISRIAVALDYDGADTLIGQPVITKQELEAYLLTRFRGDAKRLAPDQEDFAAEVSQGIERAEAQAARAAKPRRGGGTAS